MEPAQTLFPVVPGIFHGFTGNDSHIMEHNIDVPVVIAVGQLLYQVASGSQLLGDGVAGFIGGVFTDHFVVAVRYPEHPTAQLIAGVGGLGELDSAILGVGVGYFCTGTGSDGDLLFHIGIVFPVGFIPVMDFPDIVFSGCQLTGVGIAVSIGFDGVHQIFVGIEDLEAPALGAAIDSRFGDSEIAVVSIAEADGRSLIHSNLNGFHRGIADPVGIADSNFLGIVSAGNQIADCHRAVSTGGEGRTGNSLGAGRICVDSDLPAGQVCTGVGGLDQLQTALMQVVNEADRSSAACCKGNLLGIGTCTGVQRTDCTVSVTDFLDVVGSRKQSGDGNLTTAVGGVRTGHQGCAGRVRIDTELPTFQVLAILGGLGQGQTAGVQLVGEAYRCSAVCCDGNFLGIGAGAVILSSNAAGGMSNLLNVVGTGLQTGNGDLAAGISDMGTRHKRCAGAVAVDTELPSGEVFTILRSLGQTHIAGVQLISEAHRSRAACGDGNLLGICTGTIVQRIDAAVRMAQFLNVVGSGRQAGDGNLTAGIGGIGTGNQGCAGAVAIDTKAPVGKILTILRCFGQAECSKRRSFQLEIGIEIAIGRTCQGDGW